MLDKLKHWMNRDREPWSRKQRGIYFLFAIAFAIAGAFAVLGFRELYQIGLLPQWSVLAIGFGMYGGLGFLFWRADTTIMVWARKLKLLK